MVLGKFTGCTDLEKLKDLIILKYNHLNTNILKTSYKKFQVNIIHLILFYTFKAFSNLCYLSRFSITFVNKLFILHYLNFKDSQLDLPV